MSATRECRRKHTPTVKREHWVLFFFFFFLLPMIIPPPVSMSNSRWLCVQHRAPASSSLCSLSTNKPQPLHLYQVVFFPYFLQNHVKAPKFAILFLLLLLLLLLSRPTRGFIIHWFHSPSAKSRSGEVAVYKLVQVAHPAPAAIGPGGS